MSDELRDMLRGRAEAIDVPSGDVGTVVGGGRSIKARRYTMAAVASVVTVALIAWGATTETGLLDRGTGEVANPGPNATDATPGERHVAGACEGVPFRPGYLPDGWSYVLKEGEGGQAWLEVEQHSPSALGHWSPFESVERGDPPNHINVFEYDRRPFADLDEPVIFDPEPIDVLRSQGEIGRVDEGYGVDFTYEGCRFLLAAYGPQEEELRRVARNLQPRDSCAGRDTRTPDPLLDGRHFGYITAIEGVGIDFDEAEFLTGEEANVRAREDGAIGPDETVPNDYYIDDNNASVRGMSVSRDVEVLLETTPRDGMPGVAAWEYPELVCMFYSEEPIDMSNMQFPFWITVREGLVTKIEQQYLP